MSDDIVTRLRDKVAAKPEFVQEGSTEHLLNKAANEIERLRADLDRWKECSECAYWNIRRAIECAEWALPSPHPLWSDLNELVETLSWMEKLLDIPNRWESMKERAVRGE